MTYAVKSGRYERLGRTVIIECRLTLTSRGGGSGGALIGGLPYRAAPHPPGGNTGGLNVILGNVTFPSGRTQAVCFPSQASASLSLSAIGSGAGVTTIGVTDIDQNAIILIGGTYITDEA